MDDTDEIGSRWAATCLVPKRNFDPHNYSTNVVLNHQIPKLFPN